MRNLFDHSFTLKPGTQVYVPTAHGRSRGEEIKAQVEKVWKAPSNYFHLRNGGHLAAARRHKDHPWVASLDLQRFFDQITRSRVHRSLRRIGFQHAEAYEMACDSVVDKSPPHRRFSLPFGFVQSPLLASVVLSHSSLGGAIRRLQRSGITVTVYVDDVTVSGTTEKSVSDAVEELDAAAALSNLAFNQQKKQGPCGEVIAFNIRFGSGSFEIIEGRMDKFMRAIEVGSEWTIGGILGYVHAVNDEQHELLASRLARHGG